MNLANKLTLSRIVVIPPFLATLLPQSFGLPEAWNPELRVAALVIFIAAAITDYYDGALARKNGWISNFGQLMDPLADKVIVMAAFVGMVELKLFPSWMVILILAREFLITGLRTLAVTQGKILSADRWGKNKTITQMVTIITALVYLAARDILTRTEHWETYVVRRWDMAQWFEWALKLMMFLCVALTVYSGWNYGAKNWDLLRDDINEPSRPAKGASGKGSAAKDGAAETPFRGA